MYLGQFGDLFAPGKHTLTTDNIPVLTTLKGWKYGFETPFKADVYYVITRIFTGNKWGTSNPVMMRDADFGIVRLRAFGTFDFRIVEPQRLLKEVAGTDTFSRMKLGISMPYFSLSTGLISGSNASPSSVYRMATSSAGTLLLASASLKTLTMRERIASANSSSRKC